MWLDEDVVRHRLDLFSVLAVVLALAGGCSMRSFAVDTIGDMLASGDSVFTDDDDMELIGEALPFSLKLTESLLAESPRHRGLLLTAARGYVLYSYAYVHFAAEQAISEDFESARLLRVRAQALPARLRLRFARTGDRPSRRRRSFGAQPCAGARRHR